MKKLLLMQHKRAELAKPCRLCSQWTGDDTFLRVRADAKFTTDIDYLQPKYPVCII